MRSNSKASIIALTFLCLTLGLAGWSISERRKTDHELEAGREQQALLAAKIHRADERLAVAQHERDRQQDVLAKLPKLRPAASKPGPKENRMVALMAKNPKLLDLYLKSYRAGLSQRYGAFYRANGLTADQIGQFEDALAQHEEGRMDLIATVAAKALNNSDPAVAALHKQQNDQLKAAQTALLGDAGYQQLQQANREQVARALVNATAGNIVDTAPYTEAQASQVAQILAQASTSYRQGGQFNPRNVDWDGAIAQAEPILSPPQLESLKVLAGTIKLLGLVDTYYTQQTGN